MKKKNLGKLTDGQRLIFQRYMKCEEASKWLIKEIMHEFETQQVFLENIWDHVRKEFGVNLTNEELSRMEVDKITGEVYIITQEFKDLTDSGGLELKKLNVAWNEAKGEK